MNGLSSRVPDRARYAGLFSGLLLIAVLSWSRPAAADFTVSVEDIRGSLATIAQWQPLTEYLTRELGEKVTLLPLVTGKAQEVAGGGHVPFMINNPIVTAKVHVQFHSTLVASLIMPWGDQFAGVIFTTPATGIKTVADMHGKSMISHFFASAGGGHFFQRYHLHRQGFEVFRDFGSVKEVPRQDDIVLAVRAGVFDVGMCRTGIIEDLVRKGRARMDDFVVIDKVDDPAYPFVRSTRLYPEWYVAAMPGADAATVARMKAALLRLAPDSATARSAEIKGFEEPLPIEPLVEVLKTLKIPPLDKE